MASNTSATNPAAGSDAQPGLIQGHVEYVKGVAESAIGSVTGSQAWTASGEQDKAHGVSAMQAAAANRDPNHKGFGKAEEIAGKVAGCEGMVKEGTASQHPHSS